MLSHNSARLNYGNFNNSAEFDAAYNAYEKAMRVRPVVHAHLTNPLMYGVKGSDGQTWYVVTLAPKDDGDVIGATCTCPAGKEEKGNRPFCYHRMAAYLTHVDRMLVVNIFPEEPITQICRETGCEMDAMCPSYKVCSQRNWKEVTSAAPDSEPRILGDDPNYTGKRCPGCAHPMTEENKGYSGFCKTCWPIPVTEQEEEIEGKGPLCKRCQEEIVNSNKAQAGYCMTCYPMELAKAESDLFG